MEMEKGDRVISTNPFGGFWGTKIPKGTQGVIVKVHDHFFSATTYEVAFENGETEDEVRADDIAVIKRTR